MTTALPVVQPLCRDHEDDQKFCRFALAGFCSEGRQVRYNRAGVRGPDCFHFQMLGEFGGTGQDAMMARIRRDADPGAMMRDRAGDKPLDAERLAIQGEESSRG